MESAVNYMVSVNRLDLIDTVPLPVTFKLQAIRDIAFSKNIFFFPNVHIPQKVMREMDNKTMNVVRMATVSPAKL